MTLLRRLSMGVLGVTFLLSSVGCSSSSNDSPGSSTQGGTSGAAGNGTGGILTARGGSGPAITSAPAAWERPADCGGIGDSCAGTGIFGCGEKSSCQLMGDVCIPALASGASAMPSKSADHPYCAAYTCMTFEEASCFCTGDAAKTTKACASPAQLAGLCVGQGSSCSSSACCDGLSCVHGMGTAMVCEKPCSVASDCDTGCCTDLRDTGDLVCAAASACANPCKKNAQACTPGTSTTPNDCCQGDCLQSANPNYDGCRRHCSKNSDCLETGCCLPYSDGTYGFCVDALFCSCGAEGSTCGDMNSPKCCEGTQCSGSSTTAVFKCKKECLVETDCANGCCVSLGDTGLKVCGDQTNCPWL